MVRVWDPVVRFFHWGLAACFALAWLTAEEAQSAHEWLGYAAAALVALRVVWGLMGSHYARFGQFVRGPGACADLPARHGEGARAALHRPQPGRGSDDLGTPAVDGRHRLDRLGDGRARARGPAADDRCARPCG
ncbi:cytochrome b/b6 domain-containing protein [Cereibacter sphaeroides f. sp. denitrificans]